MSAFHLCLSTLQISIHFEKDNCFLSFSFIILKLGVEGLVIWKFKRVLFWFFCLLHFIILKDRVAGECITEKQDRIYPGLQPHSSGSEPSLSRQRRQKKREQTEHSGEKRQVGGDPFGVSHCAATWEIDFRKLNFYLEWLTVAKKAHEKHKELTEKGGNGKMLNNSF